MKVDNRFHCFGCQADGDVISFTARLFHLSPKDAAVKLAADFGINYDTHSPPKLIVLKVSEAERHKQQTDCCFHELADYRHQLAQWKNQYTPMSMQEEPHPLFLEALHNLDLVEYQLDTMLNGSDADKLAVLKEYIKMKTTKEVSKMEPIVKTPVYRESAAYAREHGELEQFRNSHWTNIACKNEIEDAIARSFDGMHLESECAKNVLALYGPERVQIILAATVQVKEWDGRFSKSTKDWANTVPLPETESIGGYDRRYEYAVSSHPAVLDGFISLVRKEVNEPAKAAVPTVSVKRKAKETEVAR